MEETENDLYSGSTWYLQDHTRDQEDNQDDVIEFDFLKLSVQHIIEKRKIVVGSLLITPTQFLFELESDDPLDRLEPELFQVVLPSKVVTHLNILLTNSKQGPNQIYKGLCMISISAQSKFCCQDLVSTLGMRRPRSFSMSRSVLTAWRDQTPSHPPTGRQDYFQPTGSLSSKLRPPTFTYSSQLGSENLTVRLT